MSRRLRDLGAGNKVPNYVYVIVETPMNSRVKYRYDEDLDLILVDKVLEKDLIYPFNQGFIPGTKDLDDEPLEAIIISNEVFLPGILIEARPIGLVEVEYEDELETQIITTPHDRIDSAYGKIRDINDLPQECLERIEFFFRNYRSYGADKWVSLKRIGGVQEAKEKILEAIKRNSFRE